LNNGLRLCSRSLRAAALLRLALSEGELPPVATKAKAITAKQQNVHIATLVVVVDLRLN
jgi:hypothetical protein